MRYDPHGRPYYVDHNNRTTTWERPIPLPPGYVVTLCCEYIVSFTSWVLCFWLVDRNTRTATWERPIPYFLGMLLLYLFGTFFFYFPGTMLSLSEIMQITRTTASKRLISLTPGCVVVFLISWVFCYLLPAYVAVFVMLI